jgi:glutamate-1-semialdehyde 2,1-aminomutase
MGPGSMNDFGIERTANRAVAKSEELHERAKRVMPGGNTRTTVFREPYPTYAVRGMGEVIVDVDGVQRVDFLNNYTSLIHGHADPDVVAAVTDQLHQGSSFGLPTPHEIDLAEVIAERVPSVEQVRFTNSGTEAVMSALQAARAYTGRPRIAKFEGAYHGNYDFAGVSTTIPDDHRNLDLPVATAYGEGTPASILENVLVLRYNDAHMAEEQLERHSDELAAVLVDPMPWRMGLIQGTGEFLNRLRELTKRHGIVLIFDEVITLRVGPGGVQREIGIVPDLTTMGKIIGGGFPVGAFGGSAEVMQVFDPRGGKPRVPHGGTFSANPITMRAGLVTMQKLTPDMFDHLNHLGAYIRANLAEALQEAGINGQVTGLGSLFGVHFHARPLDDYWSWYGNADERSFRGDVYQNLLDEGYMVAPAMTGCVSSLMTEDHANALVNAFSAALRKAIQ